VLDQSGTSRRQLLVDAAKFLPLWHVAQVVATSEMNMNPGNGFDPNAKLDDLRLSKQFSHIYEDHLYELDIKSSIS